MIKLLSEKNLLDVQEFLEFYKDSLQELFITKDNNRLYLKRNINLLKKILKTQLCLGQYEGDILKGFLIVYKEKTFRPYLKFGGYNLTIESNLLKYLVWNFCTEDYFIKLKKNNFIISYLYKYGFKKIGTRGNEELFFRKRTEKQISGGKLDDYDNQQDTKFNKR